MAAAAVTPAWSMRPIVGCQERGSIGFKWIQQYIDIYIVHTSYWSSMRIRASPICTLTATLLIVAASAFNCSNFQGLDACVGNQTECVRTLLPLVLV